MWGCFVWSEMMERTNHFITTTTNIIRYHPITYSPLTWLSSAAPCVHPAGHRLYLHPLQCPPRRPHRRRHDPLQRPQGLCGLQAWGQELRILHHQLIAHHHRCEVWKFFLFKSQWTSQLSFWWSATARSTSSCTWCSPPSSGWRSAWCGLMWSGASPSLTRTMSTDQQKSSSQLVHKNISGHKTEKTPHLQN